MREEKEKGCVPFVFSPKILSKVFTRRIYDGIEHACAGTYGYVKESTFGY